jgi:hypothetical protein
MTGEIPIDDPTMFYSLVAPTGTGLSRPIGAVVAALDPGRPDPSRNEIEAVLRVLKGGQSVLIVAAPAEDRARMIGLLGPNRACAAAGHA